MPSGITHLVLSRFSLDRLDSFGESGRKARISIMSDLGPFYLGAVGPDLPYLSVADTQLFANQKEIADNLHYKKTNAVPLRGLLDAQQLALNGNIEKANVIFSFYVGYCSHLIADGLIHPYVRDKVGDYDVASGPHRILEMKLDVFVCRKLYGTDVNGTDIHDEINWMADCTFEDELYKHYADTINSIHGHNVDAGHVKRWKAAMDLVFELAEGEFPKWYRELLGDKGVTFKNYSDLKDEEEKVLNLGLPIDADKHQIKSNFLSKSQVNFFDDVLPKYFELYPKAVVSAYNYVFNNGTLDETLIPEIDLDTGRLLSNNTLSESPALWVTA